MDSNSPSNSAMRSFRLAACRSCAGVNCNRSIAAQLRRPYGNATQYFPTRPLVRKPSVVVSPHPIRLPLDTVRVKRVRARPSAVADLDMDGVPGRESHSHEVSKTSKGLDHSDQLWHTCHARWRSFLQRGSPPPPPMTFAAGRSVENEWLTVLVIHQTRTLVAHEGRWARFYDVRPTRTRGNALWGQPVSAGGASGWRRCCAMTAADTTVEMLALILTTPSAWR